jgi:hypothetical protein
MRLSFWGRGVAGRGFVEDGVFSLGQRQSSAYGPLRWVKKSKGRNVTRPLLLGDFAICPPAPSPDF